MPEPLEATSALSYNDWVAQQSGWTSNTQAGQGLLGKIGNFFSGHGDRYKSEYETYLQNLNHQFEVDQINNARQWEEYMDSTKYQRMVADLKAAGINPALYLAGGIGAAGQPNSPSGSVSAKYKSKDEVKTASGAQWLSSAAMVLLALAKVAAL